MLEPLDYLEWHFSESIIPINVRCLRQASHSEVTVATKGMLNIYNIQSGIGCEISILRMDLHRTNKVLSLDRERCSENRIRLDHTNMDAYSNLVDDLESERRELR